MASTDFVRRKVIFLFGAGASVDADIPDTYQFVENFEAHIRQRHSQLHNTLLEIIKVREGFNRRFYGSEKKVDIEELLDTLQRLISKKDEPLLDFYEEKKFCSTLEESHFPELKAHLEDFVRERVIAKEENLEYLKELLNFDSPLEIYSTNYDTCIEQLSYLNHRKYTDGFGVYWDKENFKKKDFEIKHYKMHGSVIWYQNEKTKECVKIPVRAFSEKGEPVKLKLIYGEEVKHLLIYPAQKAEYIEPLTDLQLLFKERLFSKETKVLVVVGYSFRDSYIIHMLWDAARVNEDLHVILVSPDAQEIFKNKLKFIDKDSLSRINDRVICLPYSFHKVIGQLKNHYCRLLLELCKTEKEVIKSERSGYRVDSNWQSLLRMAIDCEFLTKAESIIKRLGKDWRDLDLGGLERQALLSYALKGWLSSIALDNGNENRWLTRANEAVAIFNTENMYVKRADMAGVGIGFRYHSEKRGDINISPHDVAHYWMDYALSEKKKKVTLLGPTLETKLEKTNQTFHKLELFRDYMSTWLAIVNWKQYQDLRSQDKEISKLSSLLETPQDWDKIRSVVLEIERRVFIKTFGATILQLA
jgi:hypothetical protein